MNYYYYDKYNENLFLKKTRTVPSILIYDDGEIAKDINVYDIFLKEMNPDDVLTEIIKTFI